MVPVTFCLQPLSQYITNTDELFIVQYWTLMMRFTIQSLVYIAKTIIAICRPRFRKCHTEQPHNISMSCQNIHVPSNECIENQVDYLIEYIITIAKPVPKAKMVCVCVCINICLLFSCENFNHILNSEGLKWFSKGTRKFQSW